MAFDPLSSLNPSDSGLLEGLGPAPGYAKPGSKPSGSPASRPPSRDEYDAPAPATPNAEAPEESLAEVPLPEGYLTRLRSFVEEL